MGKGPLITGIDVYEIEREVRDMGPNEMHAQYEPGTLHQARSYAIKVHTDGGITGEYVAGRLEGASLPLFAPSLIGMYALEREKIYNEVKRLLRHYGRMGLSVVDNALWDLAGKYYNAPVYQLLGGHRTRLPVYASTAHGDECGGLYCPEAYADFAEQCLELGYKAFKIHPWYSGPVEREINTIYALGKRVGEKMHLMIDCSCTHETFAEALEIGHACDENHLFWLEDPFIDGGVSQFAHKKLREMIKTPLLIAEHVRTLEQRMDFLISGATDFIRGDAPMEGITATMKLAHAAEALGMDVELHGSGPATRHCMAAMRNSNYLEWGLLHPNMRRGTGLHGGSSSLYLNGYADGQLEGIDENGCVPVPEGPGLGVEYNWDYIKAHQTAYASYC